jgi:DUF971 family protein
MSHEPFKIGSVEQAARVQEEERPPRDRRSIDPKAVRVDKTGGTGMSIDWKDGHQSHYTFPWLRDACPCATCNEEREQSGRKLGESPKPKPGTLPMYKALARPDEVIPTGRYAIAFRWNDGHSTGIYSWDFLRRECPCEQCKAERTTPGA